MRSFVRCERERKHARQLTMRIQNYSRINNYSIGIHSRVRRFQMAAKETRACLLASLSALARSTTRTLFCFCSKSAFFSTLLSLRWRCTPSHMTTTKGAPRDFFPTEVRCLPLPPLISGRRRNFFAEALTHINCIFCRRLQSFRYATLIFVCLRARKTRIGVVCGNAWCIHTYENTSLSDNTPRPVDNL